MVTVLQRLKLHRDNASMKVQKGKQKTAFPPNYIHCLDSSHMMLTALACKREGANAAGSEAVHLTLQDSTLLAACGCLHASAPSQDFDSFDS